MSQTPEEQAMREKFSLLVEHLSDPAKVASSLFSRSMLTSDQLDAVTAALLPRDKRQTVVSAIFARVQLCAADFHTFLEILKGEPANNPLVDQLEASYFKCKGQSNPQSHSNGADATPTPPGATPTSATGVQLSDILKMKPTNKEMTASFKYLDENGKKVPFRMWDELKQGGCQWDDLAREMGYGSEVVSIKQTNHEDPKKCYSDLISSHWFRNGDNVTWDGFIETLEDMGCSMVADKLKKVLLTKVDK